MSFTLDGLEEEERKLHKLNLHYLTFRAEGIVFVNTHKKAPYAMG